MCICGGFFSSSQEEEKFNEVSKQAKQYAIKHEKNVYLYKTDSWQYMEEQEAKDKGIYPTGGIISHLQPLSA